MLERRFITQIRTACPDVEWASSFAVLGPYDYLDVFRDPDIETALKVATIVRRLGHARTDVWGATDWAWFKDLVREAMPQAA